MTSKGWGVFVNDPGRVGRITFAGEDIFGLPHRIARKRSPGTFPGRHVTFPEEGTSPSDSPLTLSG